MTEKGIVKEVQGRTVIIVPDIGDACFGCMNAECKSGGGLISAENSLAIQLTVGQMVEVRASESSIFVQALTAFLPPALGFVSGYIFMRLFFPAFGEGAAAFTGVLLLFSAAIIVCRIKKGKPQRQTFTVTRIIPGK